MFGPLSILLTLTGAAVLLARASGASRWDRSRLALVDGAFALSQLPFVGLGIAAGSLLLDGLEPAETGTDAWWLESGADELELAIAFLFLVGPFVQFAVAVFAWRRSLPSGVHARRVYHGMVVVSLTAMSVFEVSAVPALEGFPASAIHVDGVRVGASWTFAMLLGISVVAEIEAQRGRTRPAEF